MEWNYVYGLGQRLARYKGSDKDIYHNDHLRSLRVMTHRDGSVIGQQDYNPYGEKLASESYPGKYTYNGKEYMDDWGFDLYYYGARFMDPVTGRFITPDPVKDYTNQYTYVGNNPVNRIDPTGMWKEAAASIYAIDIGRGFGDFGWAYEALYQMDIAEAQLIVWGEIKEKNRLESLKKDIEADGIITDAEALRWWKEGNGTELRVNLDRLDLSKLDPSDFIGHNDGDLKNTRRINLGSEEFASDTNLDQALVYGTITLTMVTVNEGDIRGCYVEMAANTDGFDTYNFDMKGPYFSRENLSRNVKTMLAHLRAGPGTPYKIYLEGKAWIQFF